MTTIAILASIGIIGLFTWEGVRGGAFAGTFSLVRSILAFLFAMTLAEPVGGILTGMLGSEYPAPLFYRCIAFALVFGVVFGAGRWVKIRYLTGQVRCNRHVDYGVGGALGLVNGLVVAGVLLVFWSLMPFAKFMPGDFGRVRTASLPVDAGSAVLRYYHHASVIMRGGRTFMLESEPILEGGDNVEPYGVPDVVEVAEGVYKSEPGVHFTDVNGNGEWDRGWMDLYHNHADIRLDDILPVTEPASAAADEASSE